ncbi:MAG: ATP-binding cassette domain-containing protein [Oscillospiraceae bacterium]|nr:ATP-binding cassette domain-containing protein [Oscillospiraceae bacterium]MDD6503113.1 ATP-binding cassette domain-containing protein [Oscillospiraceae bacterium]MDY4105706.1 ATP-binding cassette domain-containing protein [Oscillospiraceae bacterium]
MLTLKHVSKTFHPGTVNEKRALQDLSLKLDDGEFVTIIGSNGAGKSTMFNAICGTFLIDSGAIFLDGKNITAMPEYKRSSSIGRVFQDPMKGTAPNMTIEENLALAHAKGSRGPLAFAINKKESAYLRDCLAEFGMGLEDRMKTKVGLLSGGQRQVVTLLMCTIVPPKLLLLDEHTAALDPATAQKVMEITNLLVERHHLTTMMITHNMSAALTTGTRTIMMDDGQILFDMSGKEREDMTLDELLKMYSAKKNQTFDTDRMLMTE